MVLVGALVATVMIISRDYPVRQPKADSTKTALVLAEKDKKPKVKLELYEDFICPACGKFQTDNGDAIQQAVEAGQVELTFHPLNFLAGASSTNYSLRSASAATCAADEGKFFDYEKQLFANQPPEGGEGLSDKELIGFGEDVGLSGKFSKCVKDQKYYGWVNQVTTAASDDGIDSTPTALIDGKKVETKNFTTEFAKVLKEAYPDSEKDDEKKKD
ncbi:DsbA family protein [Stackebrandtia nassauensis]|uniref:DsbA family protein n=1 Tax=Stackebrandtia nassauensis TaxID=283811 RepID=UPI001FCCAB9B|nr:thioredoxin domain-containing protein [Stackebrandtia nassauensis]